MILILAFLERGKIVLNIERDMSLVRGKRQTKFTLKKLLMIIGYATLLQMVVIIIIGAVLGSDSGFMDTLAGTLLTNFITALTVTVAVIFVLRYVNFKAEFFPKKNKIKTISSGLIWGIFALVASWSVNWISMVVYNHFAMDVKPQQATMMLGGLSPALMVPAIISVAIVAPIFEEIVFRGLLQRTIGHYSTPLLSVLFSSILFAASHFDFYQIPGLLVLGLIFGVSYQRTKSLTTPIIAHMLNNAVFLGSYFLLIN